VTTVVLSNVTVRMGVTGKSPKKPHALTLVVSPGAPCAGSRVTAGTGGADTRAALTWSPGATTSISGHTNTSRVAPTTSAAHHRRPVLPIMSLSPLPADARSDALLVTSCVSTPDQRAAREITVRCGHARPPLYPIRRNAVVLNSVGIPTEFNTTSGAALLRSVARAVSAPPAGGGRALTSWSATRTRRAGRPRSQRRPHGLAPESHTGGAMRHESAAHRWAEAIDAGVPRVLYRQREPSGEITLQAA
jgi:hypothetical protein